MATPPAPRPPVPIVVFGASGHGKVVCDVLRANGLEVMGFVDDAVSKQGTHVLGLPVLGTSEWLDGRRARVALGIGDNRIRAAVFTRCEQMDAELVTCAHPSASIA
ncbi:MAG TPA: hypothetical protein VM580_35470, partial [Labilithrix sp.]|nr:hypothetical protein [Labilithrix sp.]